MDHARSLVIAAEMANSFKATRQEQEVLGLMPEPTRQLPLAVEGGLLQTYCICVIQISALFTSGRLIRILSRATLRSALLTCQKLVPPRPAEL
jgi:hypothetical protein